MGEIHLRWGKGAYGMGREADHTGEDKYSEDLFEIIEALSRDYLNIFVIDPNLNEFRIQKLDGYVSNRLKQDDRSLHSYDEICRQYIKDRVHPEDQGMMRERIQLENVKSILENQEEYVSNYRTLVDGQTHHFEYKYIRISNQRIIAGFRNIDEIIEREETQKQQDRMAASVFTALAKDYENVYIVNLEDETLDVRKQDGYVPDNFSLGEKKHVSYLDLWRSYINAHVIKEDADALYEAIQIDNVLQEIQNNEEFVYTYRTERLGIRYFQVRGLLLDKSNIIFGFRNITSIVEEENKKLLSVLINDYTNVYWLYPEDATVESVKQSGTVILPETGDKKKRYSYEKAIREYISRVVHPEDRSDFLERFSLKRIIEEIKVKDEYIHNYSTQINGVHYFQAKCSRFDGAKILVTFRNMDAVVEEEIRNRKELEKANEIVTTEKAAFRDAIEENAICTVVSDITEGVIIEPIIIDGVDIFEKKGIKLPVPYDEYVKEFIDENQIESLTKGGDSCFFAEKIKGVYEEEGSIKLHEYHLKSMDTYFRLTSILSKHPITGHIISHGICNDITEEKKKQIEMKRREDEKSLVIQYLSRDYQNIYLVNEASATIEVQKQDGYYIVEDEEEKKSVKEYPYDEAWRTYTSSCAHPDDKEGLYQAGKLENVVEKLKSTEEYTYNYRTINNGMRYFQFKFIRMNENQIIAGFRNIDAIVEEETKQRMALESALAVAEHANKAKTLFLNSMSHDIRTPMNAITGFTALAASNLEDKEKLAEYIQKIQISSNHLLSLINDVLDMSRIESGKVKIEEKEVYLPEVVQELRNIVQDEMNKKQLVGGFDTIGIQNAYVWCDKLRLSQVILNCLGNAIKFTPEQGTVELKIVQTEEAVDGYASYEFRIRDNGIGMSHDFVEHIFEPFERERTSTVSGVQGTGLGMAISKNIVDLMGGTITVESEPKVGTEFVIALKLRLAEGMEQAATISEEKVSGDQTEAMQSSDQEKEKSEEVSLEGMKLLLVEDNDFNREIAIAVLTEYGVIVDSAEDGSEAVDRIRESAAGQYDLVLMDIQMPTMDGYEATKIIRSMENREKARVPIIAMTANAFDTDREKALNSGMNDFISKPIDIEHMLVVINRVLRA